MGWHDVQDMPAATGFDVVAAPWQVPHAWSSVFIATGATEFDVRYALMSSAASPATSPARRAQRASLSLPVAETPFAAHQLDTEAWQRCEPGTTSSAVRFDGEKSFVSPVSFGSTVVGEYAG